MQTQNASQTHTKTLEVFDQGIISDFIFKFTTICKCLLQIFLDLSETVLCSCGCGFWPASLARAFACKFISADP